MSANQQRIRTTSIIFKSLFQFASIALPILLLLFWVKAPAPLVLGNMNTGLIISFIPDFINAQTNLPFTAKLLGFILSLIPLSVNLFIFYCLIRLFDSFKNHLIFYMKNVMYVKNIAYAILVGQLLNPLYQMLICLIVKWHDAAGHKAIAISLSQSNVGLVLMAVFIILIAWIIEEGHQLEEDQKYIV